MKDSSLFFAMRTLSRFSVGNTELTDEYYEQREARSMFWFSLVGAVLGATVWLFLTLLAMIKPVPPLLGGVLATSLLAWLTRGFHLDGLSDTADGFGGGWTKEDRLRIMKDSQTGVYGVLSLTLVLLIKAVSIGVFFESYSPVWLVLIVSASRMYLVIQATCNPYARSERGTAGSLVKSARWYHVIICFLVLCVISGLLLPMESWYKVGILIILGSIPCLYLGFLSRKKIGGVTGDVLGATAELCETLMCLALVFLP